MAGSLVSEGVSQLLRAYMVWTGATVGKTNVRFRPIAGESNKIRCRGAIGPHRGRLYYIMEILDISTSEEGYVQFKADVNIIDRNFDLGQGEFDFDRDWEKCGRGDMLNRIVVDFKNLALQLEFDEQKEFVPRKQLRDEKATPALTHQVVGNEREQADHPFSFPPLPAHIQQQLVKIPKTHESSKQHDSVFWHPLAGRNQSGNSINLSCR